MTELTLTIGQRTIKGSLNYEDPTISELFDLFKAALVGQTFSASLFNRVCKEIAEECEDS